MALSLTFAIPANYTLKLPIQDFSDILINWGGDQDIHHTTYDILTHEYIDAQDITITIKVNTLDKNISYVHILSTDGYDSKLKSCNDFGDIG